MKLEFNFDEDYSARDLPIKISALKQAAAYFVKTMIDEPEWQETREALGRNPQMVAILFCGDRAMRGYQRRFRKLDRTTDVLSFPARELPNPEESRGHLGDLIVSVETVERAAKRAGRPAAEEMLEVIIHGWLHLLGHDHIGSSDKARARARRMRSLQAELFRACCRFI
ncbi:MAG: rRNA maturation RNase YbeY [Bdellovibrionales bacterium]|nr:rRNA maturation RNase YbeY [Bdellovibrionales bacterium]